jgi:membrane-associated phospholipid phosphatase
MLQWTFSMPVMQFLADHRTPLLTKFFLLATFTGASEGYILIATLIYVWFDKTLAIRLSILVLLTMCLNHVLKIIIKNPRPFIREGTYLEKWAVSADNAKELATEYSTPSGHAMAGSAFYSYLYAAVQSPFIRVLAVIAIFLTGLSRPYLGVHYPGDVLIGWLIGLLVALAAIKFTDKISDGWNKMSYGRQAAIAVVGSLTLWLATIAINGWRIDGQPRTFLGYAGFLSGILLARPLELSIVDFDPRSSKLLAKVLRSVVAAAMVLGALLLLELLFRTIAADFSVLGYLFQYIRYTIAGFVSIFVAPLFFTKIGLAETNPVNPPNAASGLNLAV